MYLLFIPGIIKFPAFIADKTSNFQRLDFNFSFSLKDSFNLLDDPLIKVEQNFSNMTDARVVIAEDGVYYKQFYFLGRQNTIPLEQSMNAKNSAVLKSNLSSLLLFMFPSIIFWSLIIFIIYFLVAILVTYLLASIFSWAFRINIGWLNMLKTSIFSATVLIALQLILMPFYRIIWIPLIAYWLLLLIIILLLKDETRAHGKSSVLIDGGGSKDIFRKGPKQDSYDVDERGNFKGSKKKRSVDEENEGYVELK